MSCREARKMGASEGRAGSGLILNIAMGILIMVALIEHCYLWSLILSPMSAGIAYLLYLWLCHRLRDSRRALLLAAIAAAAWPWTVFFFARHLSDIGEGLWLGFFAPFAIIAIAGMMLS
jgi:hypothetical protein